MAAVICPSCTTPNTGGDALCVNCGFLLAEGGDGPAKIEPPPRPAPRPPAPDHCPACGADVPDPANMVCVDCLEPLRPRSPTRTATALRLLFADRPVSIAQTESVVLGRDPESSPVAALFASADNVSRRHASVGMAADGSAWVRDEHSTNGTFVNDSQIPSGHQVPLADGDRLRLASNITARVEVDADP